MYFAFLVILIVSQICSANPYYNGPTYTNDRDIENSQMLSSHQKKKLLADDSPQFHEDQIGQAEESDHAIASVYEAPRYRKYQPSAGDPAYIHREARLEHESEFEPEAKEKREFYDGNPSSKDASIEVILDPRAKKAVAVVENSPTGQAMYDLSGWKNAKEDVSALDNEQYAPSNQEQVVNLVYPAERTERKYGPDGFDTSNSDRKYSDAYEGNSEYAGNRLVKSALRERSAENERGDESHKKKRNAEVVKRSAAEPSKADSEKRSLSPEKRKAVDTIKQSECPPHNNPDASENINKETINKKQTEVKREAVHWTQDQINALTNSVNKARENVGEMNNLKAILSDMGLVDTSQLALKREISDKETTKELVNEKLDAISQSKRDLSNDDLTEDEDLNQENVLLKRNDREASDDEKWEQDVNDAPLEPVEKRDLETENILDEDDEDPDNPNNKAVKRSDDESEKVSSQSSKIAADNTAARKKRQNADKKEENSQETAKNINAASSSSANENIADSNKYNKRETVEKTTKEKRKLGDEEYEKRMENQIQAKIDAIKEKVKREIIDEQLKRRAKRYTGQISPSDYNSIDSYKPYLRLRRSANSGSLNNNDKASASAAANPAANPAAQSKNIRRKRANILPEKQMVYRPFQAEQDEEAEEDGEFDDNTFDNRNYLQKRQAGDEDFQYFDSRSRDNAPYMQQNYPQSRNRRSFENDYAEESNAFHGGGMLTSRKAALKNKSFNDREKRGDTNLEQDVENSDENENFQNSDSEYFGSLPQSYNGELTRYKRIKRDNPYK